VVIKYKYKGTGPYSILSEQWPPPLIEATEITPLERQVVMANSFFDEKEEGEDITEEYIEFSGPSCASVYPEKIAKERKWVKIVVNYADGGEKTFNF
jgi:hypothetical protein